MNDRGRHHDEQHIRWEVPPREWFERAALLILLALIPLRTVLAETHSFEVTRWMRNLDAPMLASPACSFFIDAVIFAVGGIVIAVAIGSRRGYRWTGAEWGALIIGTALVISTIRAGQKHLAIIGSLDFAALLVYLFALRQLLNRPWRVRLALAVVLAAGGVEIVKCAFQKWSEFPSTRAYYEQHKAELLPGGTSRGDDQRLAGMIYDYEQRLKSDLVTGHFAHPNVLASYLILIVLTGVGVAVSRWRRRPGWAVAVPAVIGMAAFGALLLTQSKGALASCVVALGLFGVVTLLRDFFGVRPRAMFYALWIGAAVAVIAIGLTLKSRPDAFGRSMLFRTMYWRGAMDMVSAEGPWGVGSHNFGRHFPRYKPVECPEEVDSPHSWIFASLAEWGVLGLAGMVVLFVGVSRKVIFAGMDTPAIALSKSESSSGSIILWTAGLAGLFLVWWVAVTSKAPIEYVAQVVLVTAISWLVCFFAVSMEQKGSPEFAIDALGPLSVAVGCGLIGFVLHGSVDLAVLHIGAATAFFALVAVVVSLRDTDDRQAPHAIEQRNRAYLAIVIGAIGLGSALIMVFNAAVPAALCGSFLEYARRNQNHLTDINYDKAAAAYDCDSTALDEQIDRMNHQEPTASALDEIALSIKLFEERDPNNSSVWNYRANLHYQRFAMNHDPVDLQQAVESLRRCVVGYPSSPEKHLSLARLLEEQAGAFVRESHAPEARRARLAAASELRIALRLDDRRIYVSKPHRLSDEARHRIEEHAQLLAR